MLPYRDVPTVLYVCPTPTTPAAAQRAMLSAWTAAAAVHLVAELADDEDAAAEMVRPGLVEAIERARRGVRLVAVASYEVIHPEITGQEAYRSVLREVGARVIPARKPAPSTARRSVAEYEQRRRGWVRAEQVSRLQTGKGQARADRPDAWHGGRIPLGFSLDVSGLVESTQEMAIVARVQELRRGGLSLERIAETMTAERYRTKEGSETWHREQVRRVLLRHGDGS